jgi:hypothetical protein
MLQQTVAGMQALASEGLFHRDLAIRNLLVFGFDPEDVSKTLVKVSDFGLTVNGYSATHKVVQDDTMPIRYLAPEALKKKKFSEKSDVWAFGVLAWELLTDGVLPYFEKPSDESVIAHVMGGGKLSRPTYAECPELSDGLWDVVEGGCWAMLPRERPTFAALGIKVGQCGGGAEVVPMDPAVAARWQARQTREYDAAAATEAAAAAAAAATAAERVRRATEEEAERVRQAAAERARREERARIQAAAKLARRLERARIEAAAELARRARIHARIQAAGEEALAERICIGRNVHLGRCSKETINMTFSCSQDDTEVHFKTKRSTPMRKMKEAYRCKRQELDADDYRRPDRYLCDGEPLDDDATADNTEMEDGEIIDVMYPQIGDIGVFIADGEMLNDPTAIAASLGCTGVPTPFELLSPAQCTVLAFVRAAFALERAVGSTPPLSLALSLYLRLYPQKLLSFDGGWQ